MIKYIIFGCIALFVIYEVVKFSVFLRIAIGRYHSKKENFKTKDEKELPKLSLEEQLSYVKNDPKQHFTQPPPRYTEASLIKTMEE